MLLVEGQDDVHVFVHLAAYHQIPVKEPGVDYEIPSPAIKVRDENGIENLLTNLPVHLKGSGIERLGVVIDADTNLQGRWESFRNKLIGSGYDKSRVPRAPAPDGTIITQEGYPIVGIWIMPDNKVPGSLEDFIKFLVPQDDLLWSRAEECVAQIPTEERHFSTIHLIKAHVHTWLAWQEQPGQRMGQAINSKYLDPDAEHARRFVAWVRRLFAFT
ncbi:MAG TPA: DUF3226 domain-containing protein [Chloroflexia bacterium]